MHRLFCYRTFSTVLELKVTVKSQPLPCRKMCRVNQEMNLVVTSSLLLSGSNVSNS